MIFPLNANRIEKLDLDPVKKIEGYIWYNNIEKVYKTWINNELHVFITGKTTKATMSGLITSEIARHEFTVTFENAYRLVINHNKDTKQFNFTVFDAIENCNIPCSLEIIDENEVSLDFVEPLTGHIYMYFE